MSVSVTLVGPAPWGFRITGGRDFRKPIAVSKVTEHSKAALGDLRPGDVIVSINGASTSEMLNVEAQNKIKRSSGQLQLQVDRSQQFSLSQTNGESSPEMLSIRFQDAVRTRDDGQSSLRSSYSSPASLSPRPSSPISPPSPGYQPGSLYSPQKSSEGRGESVVSNRRSQQFSLSQTNGESSPEMLSIRFQDAVRTRDDGQSSLRSSYSSPASLSPRPSSPISPPSPGYQPGSLYSPQKSSEGRGESVVSNRSFQSLRCSPGRPDQRSPSPHEQWPSSRQEQRSFSHSSGSPVTVVPPFNGSPSPGSYSLSSSWEFPKDQDRSSYSRSYSLDTEPAMHRLEGDSEVYKLMQENRESRAVPRQSSTFRLLQVALEMDEKGGPVPHFPSQLSPSTHKPANSSGAGVQKMHICEKCGNSITTQAVRILENRYRHPSCYICTDCGLNLKMRGHFWVGEDMFCEKHARQRHQGAGGDGAVTAVYSQS